jgi:hypothetical protein
MVCVRRQAAAGFEYGIVTPNSVTGGGNGTGGRGSKSNLKNEGEEGQVKL